MSLRPRFRSLVGLECCEVIWDPRSGAMLEIGDRVPLPTSVPNDRLTLGQRNFAGTHSIFVQCPWQLEQGQHSLEGWESIDSLRGESILAVDFHSPGYDAAVSWSNDLRLLIWASQKSGGTAYTVRVGVEYWSVRDNEERQASSEA